MSEESQRPVLMPCLRIFAVFAMTTFFTLFSTSHFGISAWLKMSLFSGVCYMFYGFVLGFWIRILAGEFKQPGFAYVAVLVLASSYTNFALASFAYINAKIAALTLLDCAFFAAVWTIGIALTVCPTFKTFFPEKTS